MTRLRNSVTRQFLIILFVPFILGFCEDDILGFYQ